MESRTTKTAARQSNFDSISNYDRDDQLALQRLEIMLAAEAEAEREKSLYRSESEKTEALMMKNPLSSVQTFSYFGLILGTFLPAAMFTRVFIGGGVLRSQDLWILGILAIAHIISAVVGFFSGKLIGKIVRETETYPWWNMILLLPFIGTFWGIVAGGAGGIIILIVGALPGAILGAMVGSIALPAFTIFHRLLKKGDMIESKHFLPLAFGITFIICGFILGL